MKKIKNKKLAVFENKVFSNKRAQITIFIIIALVLILFVVLLFIFRQKIIPATGGVGGQDPQSFIDECIKPHLKTIVEKMSQQGGYITNPLNITLDGKQISYLCYTTNYYKPCINQEPVLIKHLEDEIHKTIKNDVDNCFVSLKSQLEDSGNQVGLAQGDFDIQLAPRRVIVIVKRSLIITKSDNTQQFKEFKSVLSHPLYDLAVVAQEITSQEAKYCNFESVGFGLLYPDFSIDRFKTGSLSTIYTLNHKPTNQTFKFAIRGCVMPPGF